MTQIVKISIIALVLFQHVLWIQGHTYHLGDCSVIEPMPNFEINKFLGKWYVIQKTSTGSRCLVYNFTRTSEPNEYKIEQVSEHPVLGLVHDNKYHYTGKLKINNPDVPAKMSADFPLSVAGSASYTVFMTDYDTYAGVYSCQKLAFAHRHSATIMSRTKTLDRVYIDKLRSKLSASNINPFDLSNINQTRCEVSKGAYDINVNEDTFSPHNIGNAVKKAGEKVGNGVEYVAEGVKKVYHTVAGKKDNKKQTEERPEVPEDREEQVVYRHHYNLPDPDSEWIP